MRKFTVIVASVVSIGWTHSLPLTPYLDDSIIAAKIGVLNEARMNTPPGIHLGSPLTIDSMDYQINRTKSRTNTIITTNEIHLHPRKIRAVGRTIVADNDTIGIENISYIYLEGPVQLKAIAAFALVFGTMGSALDGVGYLIREDKYGYFPLFGGLGILLGAYFGYQIRDWFAIYIQPVEKIKH